MSLFYTAYLIHSAQPAEALRPRFSRVEPLARAGWWLCDRGDHFVAGLFEPGSDFTTALSAQFGEAIFVAVDERDNQMEYEHAVDGQRLRKLSWLSDGSASHWECVEGEREDWEEAVLFSPRNLTRTLEYLSYSEDDPATLRALEAELHALWQRREYLPGGQWPQGEGTMADAALQQMGLVRG